MRTILFSPFRVSPYLVITGAVAAAVAAVLQTGDTEAIHQNNYYLPGVNDGGKMYDDIETGTQCAPNDWLCYMTMTADHNTSYSSEVTAALSKWNNTQTTLWYNLVGLNLYNDVHFKIEGTPTFPSAVAWDNVYNDSYLDCDRDPGMNPPQTQYYHNCEPPAPRQPERWFYERVWINDANFSTLGALKSVALAHEMGHGLGLTEYEFYSGTGSRLQCPVQTIMDATCIFGGVVTSPTNTDECSVNHVGYPAPAPPPLMYGNDTNYYYAGC